MYGKKRLKWCQYCRGPVNQASMGLRAVGRARWMCRKGRQALPFPPKIFRGSAHSTDAIDAIPKQFKQKFCNRFFFERVVVGVKTYGKAQLSRLC